MSDLLRCRPCWTNADFSIRNFSLTHEVGYTLKLRNRNSAYLPTNSYVNSSFSVYYSSLDTSSRHVLPPPYSLMLNFRGTIPPSGSVTINPKLWITRPGTYSLDGWRLDTEVYEQTKDADSNTNPSLAQRKVRHRYSHEQPISDRTCIVVQNASQIQNRISGGSKG